MDESNQSHLPAADSFREVGSGAPHDDGVIDASTPGTNRSYGGYEYAARSLNRAADPAPTAAHAVDAVAGAEVAGPGDVTMDGVEQSENRPVFGQDAGHGADAPLYNEDVAASRLEEASHGVGGAVAVPTSVPSRPARLAGLAAWGRPLLPLGVILLVAAALRIYGYNWDEGADLHPDERGIVGHIRGIALPHSWAEFWSPASPLNPHFSAYGHLPFYLTAIFAHTLAFLGSLGGAFAGLASAATTEPGIIHSGRVLSGLADTGTLLFVFLIGRLVYSRGVGLLAAGLGAFTVLNLEFSHFANVDTFLAFCTTGAVYFCARIVREGRWTSYLWAGVWIGLALACKVSAAPLLVPLVVAHAYRGAGRTAAVLSYNGKEVTTRLGRLPANPLLLLLALASTVVAVFVTMPYAFIDFSNWWSDVWGQLQLAQGITESPFTRKFSGLPSYWYPLQQLIGWTMGLPLGLAAVAGLLVALGRQIRRRNGMEMVLLSWAVVFFVLAGGQYMKFLRYMLPLAPILTIFAAALLVRLWIWARSPGRSPRRVLAPFGFVVVAAVVLLNTLYGLMHESIYTAENSRLQATRWMAANVPASAAITVEDWDETLPFGTPGLVVPSYRSTQLTTLGQNADSTATTVPMYVSALQSANYITIASARDFGSVAHQPTRYPYSIRWYQGLFSGAFNFRLVKSFVVKPHLGPITLNDAQSTPSATQYTSTHLWYEADQNMSEYDHAPVYIFKRVGTISTAKATTFLTDNSRLQPSYAAYDPTHPMTLSKAVQQADAKAPPLNASFPADNPLDSFPILGWLIVVELLGLLALPLVLRACRGLLRDGGYALTKTAGIVVVGYLVWMAASLHLAAYSRGLIVGACAVLLVLSLGLGLGPRELWRELKARRRPIIMAELVFLGAFLALVAVRAAYPDLWHINYGGERTQEISFTNSILRSQYFPPADPWFAGGTLNYYYYGQYLTGMLMKLSGIPLPISFNLALPTLFALLLSTAFAIGYNATGRAWVGAMAASLEGVLGNLGPVQQFASLAPVHAPSSLVPGVAGLRDAFSGLFAVLGGTAQLSSSFFWTSSRILATPPPNSDGVINEFPIWSFTYGDMHAHVVDTPIVLCAVALALAVSGLGSGRTGPSSIGATPRQKLGARTWLALGLLMAVIVGATGPTNLWDLPTSVFLITVGFGLRGWFVQGRRSWTLLLRDIVAPGAALGVACLLLYRPFYTSVLGISSGFTFLQPHTPTDQWLLHFGLPLFLLVSFLVLFLWRTLDLAHAFDRLLLYRQFERYYSDRAASLPRLAHVSRAMMRRSQTGRIAPTLLSGHIFIAGIVAVVVLGLLNFSTLALTAALLTVALVAFVEACARWQRLDWSESQPFGLALAVIGLGLTAIPDLVMQNEAGRMNTFFKLYNQAWPLIALAGALGMYGFVSMRRRSAPEAVTAPVPARPITVSGPVFAGARALFRPAPALALPGGGSFTPAGRVWSMGSGGRAEEDGDARTAQSTAAPVDRAMRAFDEPTEVGAAPPASGVVDHDAVLNMDRMASDSEARSHETASPPSGAFTSNAGAAGYETASSEREHGFADAHDGWTPVTVDQEGMDEEAALHGDSITSVTDLSGHEVEAPAETVAAAPISLSKRGSDLFAALNRISYVGVLWWAALVALIAGAALFPTFGIFNHLQIRSIWAQEAAANVPTGLDGAAFVRVLYPGDWAAINWINDNIGGDPVLLTSERGSYTNFAAKATMFTGLPTVSTWPYEDGQERYNAQNRPGKDYPTNWINQLVSGAVTWNGSQWVNNIPRTAAAAAQTATRQADVETMYNTPDASQAMALLKEYHVSYIYVGTAEHGDPFFQSDEMTAYGHAGYDPAGLAKFDRMVSSGQLTVVYPKTRGVEIYKVRGA